MKWLLIGFLVVVALALIGGEILHVMGDDDRRNR